MKVGTFCNGPECLGASNDKICFPPIIDHVSVIENHFLILKHLAMAKYVVHCICLDSFRGKKWIKSER